MENKNNTKLDDNHLKQAAGGYYGGFPYIDQWKCARCGSTIFILLSVRIPRLTFSWIKM